ncbi:MAG: hypothetical protein KKB50_02740 [Planctomycetes bacterium]|nr:hypothetical protein [Planctomycetota bacterium]
MRSRMMWFVPVVVASTCAAVLYADSDPTGQPQHRYEWRANTFTGSTQAEAALDVDQNGSILVVWSSRRQQAGQYGVYAQRFAPDGVALGAETCLNLWTRSHQSAPTLDIDGQGKAWVVWQSHGQDGHAGSIIARRFDANLTGGSEIAVNQQWRGHQGNPAVASAADGTALVVWTSVAAAKQPPQIRARLLAATGQPVGDEFSVSSSAQRYETTPAVAALADGRFAVVFAIFDDKMCPAGVRMQRFDRTGQRVGEEINVSGPRKNSQIEPVIAATQTGGIVAWLDAESDGSDYGVLARRFAADGQPLGEAFVVNTTRPGPQNAPALAVARDGSFAIAWNSSDGDETGVFTQRFAADGTRSGEEFRLTKTTKGNQAMRVASGTPRLVFGQHGELICAWNGDGGFGDEKSANVTMCTPQALDLAGKVQGITEQMKPATPLVAMAGGPEPHEPPIFDPKTIDHAEREFLIGGRDTGFTAIVSTGWTPPDPHLAVGPDHVVVMTNGAIAFFQKDGTLDFQDEIEDSYGFWGSVGATGFVFDPEVIYDELSGRFFAMAAEGYGPGNTSYALVAVSDDSNPNGTWHKYRFSTTELAGYMFDSPNIGVDEDVMYITGDGFGLGANYPVYTFDKASLLAGNPPASTRSLTLSTSTQSAGFPPVSFDSPPALYFAEHKEGSLNTSVRLLALRDPLGSPYFTATNVTVPGYGPPEDPPQMGTSSRPNTFDARFWSVAYRNGSLWAAHHINSSRVVARWYQFAMNGWPESGQEPTLVQSGDIDLGADVRTFFNSITVDDNGTAAMCYARSSPSEYISMGTAFRYASDPAGTVRDAVIRKASTGPYSSGRWGDYSAVNVDPSDGRTFWAHHEYAEGGAWRTWVTGFMPSYSPGDMNCDGLVNGFDIDGFILAIDSQADYEATYPACDYLLADMNNDGLVNGFDIDGFVDLLGG